MITNIVYYEVGDVYTEDGRGPWTCIARFSSEEEAIRHSVNNGNYGGKASVTKVNLMIADTIAELDEIEEEVEFSKALAKLTEKEIKLLKKRYKYA